MKYYWEWEADYFENYILRNVELPQEFTVQDFMVCFNKLPAMFRTVNKGRWITAYNLVLDFKYFGYCHRVVSANLHAMLSRGVLKAKYVSNGSKTETIFSKV